MSIKVLLATARSQGQRDSDFFWCTEGEMLRLGFVCDHKQRNPDRGCGCQRDLSGMDSSRGTTTAVVAEADMTREQYIDAILATMDREGWTKHGFIGRDDAATEADQILNAVADLPVGTIVERRGNRLQPRDPVLGQRGQLTAADIPSSPTEG